MPLVEGCRRAFCGQTARPVRGGRGWKPEQEEILRHSQRKRRAMSCLILNSRRHSLTLPADAAARRARSWRFCASESAIMLSRSIRCGAAERHPFGGSHRRQDDEHQGCMTPLSSGFGIEPHLASTCTDVLQRWQSSSHTRVRQ